jgi:hypothetical protein
MTTVAAGTCWAAVSIRRMAWSRSARRGATTFYLRPTGSSPSLGEDAPNPPRRRRLPARHTTRDLRKRTRDR